MAIAERELGQKTKILTYEDYLNEGEIRGRYDIIGGVRYWMPSPLNEHQDVALNIAVAFRQFQRTSNSARAYVAPVDILITSNPLHVRQPDVLLISNERYGTELANEPPWRIAPELVVEVLSPSNSEREIAEKLLDYSSINVLEAWLASYETRKIEQWQLSATDAPALIGTFTEGQTLRSISFPDLSIDVSSVFEF